MKEETLHRAIEQLEKTSKLECDILNTEISSGRQSIDAQILIKHTNKSWKFNAEVKSKIVPAQITHIVDQLKKVYPYILIAEYITTQAKSMLRNLSIPYMDTAGNIFFEENDLLVFIETNQTNRNKLNLGDRTFTKAGLKVIYLFLINPEYLNKPYRFIGNQANVTIDTVRRVIQGLLQNKYIIQRKVKKYQFVDRTKLFQEWVTAYNKVLRPKLKQKRYKLLQQDLDWKKLDLPERTIWGGDVAAEIVTDHLIANKGLIYTELPFQEVMKHLKIIPDPNGYITLIEKFWKDDNELKIANHFLIYADLINESDPRYLETADKIYKEYVQNQL